MDIKYIYMQKKASNKRVSTPGVSATNHSSGMLGWSHANENVFPVIIPVMCPVMKWHMEKPGT